LREKKSGGSDERAWGLKSKEGMSHYEEDEDLAPGGEKQRKKQNEKENEKQRAYTTGRR